MNIKVEMTKKPKQKPDQNNLSFGKVFTDHMFLYDYKRGEGWINPRIEPYHALSMDPSTMVLHYAQSVFEGLKAYHGADGSIRLFRMRDNFERMNRSDARLCIPHIDVDECLQALTELLKLDRDWIPSAPGTTLYIRPTVIAMDPYVGVKASDTYTFFIILSPVGAYYPKGLAPVGIYVEDSLVRTVKGGLGEAKTGGNYAASIMAGEIAKEKGYEQVLWLDGAEHKYVDEVGSMNMFFRFKDELTTPRLAGSVLDGITRKSVIQLAADMGEKVVERDIPIAEVYEKAASGDLIEAFGTGTACVVSPVGKLFGGGREYAIGNGDIGELSQKLYDQLTGIQYGTMPDPYGWMTIIE